MREFYNKALLSLAGLLALCAIASYFCVSKSFIHLYLLPSSGSDIHWHIQLNTDAPQGGASAITLNEDRSSLSVDFTLINKIERPYTAVNIMLDDETGKSALIDFSKYHSISFNVKCAPANILTMGILTFDEKISVRDDFLTYRGPSTFFSCKEGWSFVEIDLSRLEIPQWWFDMFKLDLSSRGYTLNKVPKITFGSTSQSPTQINAKVQFDNITFTGRNWNYLYLLGVLLVLVWGAYAYWFFKQLTVELAKELQDKIQRDRPLIAYQQLSMEPHKDKEQSTILRYMATEYANADLDVDTLVAAIGVNRNKINDILKSELGFTFTGYLNKLRLTEAARLLAEKEGASVAEIAYLVGYKNVSYFNKLFKEEYNCTPKAFKILCHKTLTP
jgi:AraC-like DNA-binding protein